MSRHRGDARATAPLSALRPPYPASFLAFPRRELHRLPKCLGLFGTIFLLACGIQGPPRPPRVQKPEAVTDLVVSQIGRTLLLTFTPPLRAMDGECLTKSLEVEIFRVITPSAETPPGALASDPFLTLQPEDLARYMPSTKIVFPLLLSDEEFARWRGASFTFALRSLTRGFRRRAVESDLSNAAHLRLLGVSGPVEDLRIEGGEKALALSWSPPSGAAEDSSLAPLSGYRIYRSRTGNPGSFEVLAETTSPDYQDHDFEFDRTLFYRVRALFRAEGQEAESQDSATVTITPRDIYPPAVPAGLSAIYTGQAVELIWSSNSEADLGGYNVYRRAPGESFEKVNQELLSTPIVRDASVEPGRIYFYRVTAVDLNGNESAPSAEVEVEAR